MKHFWIMCLLLAFAAISAKELKKSDQRKLKAGHKAIQAAEESNTGKDFKKYYGQAKRHIKSLKRKYKDNPQVADLEKKVDALAHIAVLEKERKKLETSIKKLKGIFKRMKAGRRTNDKEKQKYVVLLQTTALKFKQSGMKRFDNTIKQVEDTIQQAENLGIKIPSAEDIENKIKLDKAIAQLNYGQRNIVKSLEKNLDFIEKAKSFDRANSRMPQIEAEFKQLVSIANNFKVQSLANRYQRLKEQAKNLKNSEILQQATKDVESGFDILATTKRYKEIERSLPTIKTAVERLHKMIGDEKMKPFSQRYQQLLTRANNLNHAEQLLGLVRRVQRRVDYLEGVTITAFEVVNQGSFSREDRSSMSRSAHTLGKAIQALQQAQQDSDTIKTIRDKKDILETDSSDEFISRVSDATTILDSWDNSMDKGKVVVSHCETICKKMAEDVSFEFGNLQKNIADVKKTPKKLSEDLKSFKELLKTSSWFVGAIHGVPTITKISAKLTATKDKVDIYEKYLYRCSRLASPLERGNAKAAASRIPDAQEIAGDDPFLTKSLAHYQKLTARWATANKEIRRVMAAMTRKIEQASKKTTNDGYTLLKNKYPVIEANRLHILKDIEALKGKAIKGIVWQALYGSGRYGWRLKHGEDLFLYVWDPQTREKLEAIWQSHKKAFNKFKNQIIKNHGLKGDCYIHWSNLGFLNTNFVAVVDGVDYYTPQTTAKTTSKVTNGGVEFEVKSETVYKQETIQIVKVRIIAVSSKYYTYWSTKNMNDFIDFSDIKIK